MSDREPLLTDREIDQIHLEEWSDGGEYRIVLRVARRVQALAAERALARFLEQAGKYVTNDACREAAEARAAEAEREACEFQCAIVASGSSSEQYRLGANECFDRIRARRKITSNIAAGPDLER